VIAAREPGHYPVVQRTSLAIELPREAAVGAPEANEARLAALVRDHFDFVWRLLRRQGLGPSDADDAAQHVFMTATRKLARIRPGAERNFLYGTALRVAANAHRATRRRAVEAPLEETPPATVQTPDEHAELSRAWSLLDELLAKLPPELARVLALVEIEQLEVKEAAQLERIPVGTAASRLRRARAQFHELLAAAADRNPFQEEP
jgi:RNA polymerase sigma-70 factor (ECF subfamily)